VFLTIVTLYSFSLAAQLRLPIGNGIAKELRAIIEDYPNHFSHITGKVLSETNGTTVYACNTVINGAEDYTITKHANEKAIYSWQATMLTTESFEKARQKFKSLFNQLNNLSVKLGSNNYRLKGDYINPSEEMKFTSVPFSAEPGEEMLKKFRTELVIQFSIPMEWKVKILVYEKEREDDERGEQREGK
jgi:hypothetical protein